ncbi:MAG: aldo/keto reductase [Desulfocapsa sp.]|nr:aldo/keto reductase [Desulfocapsa sp.]
MEYRFLGKTGVQVSSLCFGTMTFGAEADKKESIRMFELCREAGINIFDCANKYSDGKAESILGDCAKHCRDDIIITTKGTSRVDKGVNASGSSRKHLMLELEKSLKRLQTDYIDIYFIHYFDPHTSMESTLRFLDDSVSQGKILYTGVSNWAAWQIMKSLHISQVNYLNSIDCIQPMYNLIKRQAEVEILPLAQDQQLGVLSYSPIGAGVLTGKYTNLDSSESARLHDKDYYNKRYRKQSYFETAEKFTRLANDLGHEPAALAISWTMSHPAVTAPIIGARNITQLKSSLKSVQIEMTSELRQQITSLSSAPDPAHDRLEEETGKQSPLR